MTESPVLVPGYAHLKRGTSSFRGVLRYGRKGVAAWTCRHDHFTAMAARKCAEAELERREQAGREVFILLHCRVCSTWARAGGDLISCPRCLVPREQVKIAVLERAPG